MNRELIEALRGQRAPVRARWEALMRIERVPTPLGHPDTLAYLFDRTFDEVLSVLPGADPGKVEPRPDAACECNPMGVYFPALEQALLEAVVLLQAGRADLAADERRAGLNQVCTTIRAIARREMAVYDEVCFETKLHQLKQGMPSHGSRPARA